MRAGGIAAAPNLQEAYALPLLHLGQLRRGAKPAEPAGSGVPG